MASITSVSLGETRANKVPAVILFLVGMGLLAAGYTLAQADTSMACLAIGALAAVGGIAWFFLARTKYMVKMRSSWGEAYALQSPGKARIQRIVTAMNEAIARRG